MNNIKLITISSMSITLFLCSALYTIYSKEINNYFKERKKIQILQSFEPYQLRNKKWYYFI